MTGNEGRKRPFWRSFADALRGVCTCLKTERNMRFHLTACFYVLFFSFRMQLTRGERGCLFLAIGLVMGAEALNTAIEKLCDFAQKGQNPLIHKIKDMAAGGVLLCALAAAFCGAWILFRPEFCKAFFSLWKEPLTVIFFLLSLFFAFLFVFIGPQRLKGALDRIIRK